LHAPVDSFKIRRDKNLGLVLETETALDAKSTAEKILSGTLRFDTETVTIIHQFIEAKAILSGVQTLSVSQRGNRLQEVATVHELKTTLLDPSKLRTPSSGSRTCQQHICGLTRSIRRQKILPHSPSLI
jgi:hypothetical protein